MQNVGGSRKVNSQYTSSSNLKNRGNKKLKGVQKAAAMQRERKQWANFVRGMDSEEEDIEKPGADTSRQDTESEDLISKQIRDEALLTWQLGKNLGISGSMSDEAIVSKLVELDERGKTQIVVDKEGSQNVY